MVQYPVMGRNILSKLIAARLAAELQLCVLSHLRKTSSVMQH